MSLRDIMAADWSRVFNATGDFATSGIIVQRIAGGVTFTITAVIGDAPEGFAAGPLGNEQTGTATAVTQRSAWRAACLAAQGTAADPERGDSLTVPATDPLAGVWYVASVAPDVGDGFTLTLTRPEHFQIAAPGAAQVV